MLHVIAFHVMLDEQKLLKANTGVHMELKPWIAVISLNLTVIVFSAYFQKEALTFYLITTAALSLFALARQYSKRFKKNLNDNEFGPHFLWIMLIAGVLLFNLENDMWKYEYMLYSRSRFIDAILAIVLVMFIALCEYVRFISYKERRAPKLYYCLVVAGSLAVTKVYYVYYVVTSLTKISS